MRSALAEDFDRMQLPADDVRRRAVRLANPISDKEPLMRTSLLPSLFKVAIRNIGRGFTDLALFEVGQVFRVRGCGWSWRRFGWAGGGADPGGRSRADQGRGGARRGRLPDQPRLVGCLLTGKFEAAGWWGEGRQANLYDAIEAAREVLSTSRVPLASGRARKSRGIRGGAPSSWSMELALVLLR